MTRYYPVVAILHYKDKFIDVPFELRLRMVELKRLECPTKNCYGKVSPRELMSRSRMILHTVPTHCPICKATLIYTPEYNYKIYTHCDKYINGDLLLAKDALVSFMDSSVSKEHGERVMKFRRHATSIYQNMGRVEFYRLFENYERAIDFLNTAKPIKKIADPNKKKSNFTKIRRVKIVYTLKKVPTKEELVEEFRQYQKRKMIDNI